MYIYIYVDKDAEPESTTEQCMFAIIVKILKCGWSALSRWTTKITERNVKVFGKTLGMA